MLPRGSDTFFFLSDVVRLELQVDETLSRYIKNSRGFTIFVSLLLLDVIRIFRNFSFLKGFVLRGINLEELRLVSCGKEKT